MGIGIVLRKMEDQAEEEEPSSAGLSPGFWTGTNTPHSQLRQVSLGLPVALSFTSRPL